MTSTRLISADSHVAVSLDAIRERVPSALHEAFDDAIAEQARIDAELKRRPRALARRLGHGGDARPRLPRPGRPPRGHGPRRRRGRGALLRGERVPRVRARPGRLAADQPRLHRPPRRLRRARPRPAGRLVPGADHRHPVRGVGGRAARGPRRRARCTCPTSRASSASPTTTRSVYDPLWGVLQETGISISHHLGNRNSLWDVFRRDPTPQPAIFTSLPALALSEVIAWWILTGTLERFPGLQIVFVEPSLYWIPGFLAQLDRKAAAATTSPACASSRASTSTATWRARSWTTRSGSAHAPPRRHREHPVVDRLPAPGDDVAALAGGRRASVRRRSPTPSAS